MSTWILPRAIVIIAEEIELQRLSVYIKHLGAEKLVFGSDHTIGLTPDWLETDRNSQKFTWIEQ